MTGAGLDDGRDGGDVDPSLFDEGGGELLFEEGRGGKIERH